MNSRIVAVSGIYPTRAQPESGSFVAAMLRALGENGATVEMIAPQSLASLARGALRAAPARAGGDGWPVRRPPYLSVSSRLLPWGDTGARWSYRNFQGALRRGLARTDPRCDFVYAHFFGPGWAALDWCEQHRVGCVAVLGESTLDGYYNRVFGTGVFERNLPRFAGIVASSKENEAVCRAACPGLGDRLIHLPNAVDTGRFKPRDRAEARMRLGLPAGARIAAFCGHFIERKGPLRVMDAVRQTAGMQGVYLGQGSQRPEGPGVLHAGPVKHGDLPWWLAAADVFVLPSLAEGMSNAILEAMACGLPVVVSDRPFNRSFLDESCAYLVDPLDPAAIAAAFRQIEADPGQAALRAENARRRMQQFTLAARAAALLEFGRTMTARQYPARQGPPQ